MNNILPSRFNINQKVFIIPDLDNPKCKIAVEIEAIKFNKNKVFYDIKVINGEMILRDVESDYINEEI